MSLSRGTCSYSSGVSCSPQQLREYTDFSLGLRKQGCPGSPLWSLVRGQPQWPFKPRVPSSQGKGGRGQYGCGKAARKAEGKPGAEQGPRPGVSELPCWLHGLPRGERPGPGLTGCGRTNCWRPEPEHGRLWFLKGSGCTSVLRGRGQGGLAGRIRAPAPVTSGLARKAVWTLASSQALQHGGERGLIPRPQRSLINGDICTHGPGLLQPRQVCRRQRRR